MRPPRGCEPRVQLGPEAQRAQIRLAQRLPHRKRVHAGQAEHRRRPQRAQAVHQHMPTGAGLGAGTHGARIIAQPVKAAICERFGEPLTVGEVELDAPQAGEVSVDVRACGVCRSDITLIDGHWGGELPAVYGHEVAGVVADVGDGVEKLAAGDHVVVTLVRTCGACYFCARGESTQCEGRFDIDGRAALKTASGTRVTQGLRVAGFAERVTVHASQAVAIPKDVPLESACLLSCAVATGFGAVRNIARVEAGASVVVVGAGGVGVNSVQAARIAGAELVIAVDVSESRLAAARDLGATALVNSSRSDAVEKIRYMTHGRGADYTFITTGNLAAIELGLRMSRRAGTVVMVGMTASGETVAISPGDVADAGLRLLGCRLGAIQPEVDIPALIGLYRAGRLQLDVLVTARFPLDAINEGVAATRRGAGLRSVIVM
jgi:S-(hydroxymethyl)glutathione dehydrogenase / alcohol dehydrogenase